MQQKKSKKGLIIALIVLAAVLVAAVVFYFAARPATAQGEKTVAVQVVHADGTTKDFTLHTDQEYLGRALVEGNVVVDDQGQFGIYILTVDGETVDEAKQEWWCITKDGESLNTGADATPIADGDKYELTFTVGYDF